MNTKSGIVRCTSIASTSCMKYTGPSMPTFNLYCDEDLDIVLSVLGEKLEQVYRERGLDLSPLTFPSCFDLTNIQKTNLVSVLNGILSKICEIEDKGVIVKTSIDNVRVFLDKLPDTFWSTCITPPDPCDNEITLTDLLKHIISEICDLFSSLGLGSPARLQWLVADPNYGNIQSAANNYAANLATLNGHTSSISTLQTKTADVNLVTDALSTSLNLTTAVTSLDASLLTTLQLVTGGTAVSNPTYALSLNPTGVNKASSTYPASPSSVKTVLNNLIYDVLALQSAGSSVVTSVSTTRTGAHKADVTLNQTGGTTTLVTSLNVQPYYIRLATNYPTTPHLFTNGGSGTATGSGVLSKYDAFAFHSGSTTTNAPSSWYSVSGTQTGDRVIIQQTGLYKVTVLNLGVIKAPGLPVSTYSLTSNVLTINTASAHGFQTGQTVIVSNLTDADINGSYVITGTTSTSLTANKTRANIGSTTPGSDASVRLSHLNMTLQILKTTNTGFTNWSAAAYSNARFEKTIYSGAFSDVLTIPFCESFTNIMSLNADDVIGMGLAFSQNGNSTTTPVRYYYTPSLSSSEFVGVLMIEQLT